MIVVDTNVIAAFSSLSKGTDVAEQVWIKDGDWYAPRLWVSEFRNIIVMNQRLGLSTPEICSDALLASRGAVNEDRTHDVDDEEVLELALRSGCTAYDCEFVALAEMLDVPLLTWDKQLLKQFPRRAVTPEKYLNL